MKLPTWQAFKRSVTRTVDAEECYAAQQCPPPSTMSSSPPLTGAARNMSKTGWRG